MAGHINVNTVALRHAAVKLEKYQMALDSSNGKVKDNMSEMREIWQDDSNAAREKYVQKMENVAEQIETKLSPGIYSLSDKLTNLASNIDQWNATHK